MDLTEDTPLPVGFLTIEQIRNLSNDEIKSGSLVSVIGIVKDYQAPMQTAGTGKSNTTTSIWSSLDRLADYELDAKCTLGIVDQSMLEDTHELKISIFLLMEKMPKSINHVDLVLIRRAKVCTSNVFVGSF